MILAKCVSLAQVQDTWLLEFCAPFGWGVAVLGRLGSFCAGSREGIFIMLRRSLLWCLLLATSLAGCGDNESASNASVLRTKTTARLSEELARKKAMQAITATNITTKETVTWTPWEVLNAISLGDCGQAKWNTNSGGQIPSAGCINVQYRPGVEYAWSEQCASDMVLRIAQGIPVTVGEGNSQTSSDVFQIEPQPLAGRASLLDYAIEELARSAWERVAGLPFDLRGCENPSAAIAVTAELARSVNRLWDLREELQVSVSESERTSTPNRETAAYRFLSSNELSRYAAVRGLVGGRADEANGEFFTVPGQGVGFCTLSRLTAQGQKALSILRESGISPTVILASKSIDSNYSATEISTENILDTSSVEGGSVRQRLETRLGGPATSWGAAISGTSLLDTFGLEVKDFDEARRYLAQELKAFSRSMTQTTTGSDSASIPAAVRFASVESPVGPIDPAFYSAIARSAPRPMSGALEGDASKYGYFAGHYARPCVDREGTSYYGGVFSSAGRATDSATSFRRLIQDSVACVNATAVGDTATPEQLAPLSVLVRDLSSEYQGRLTHFNVHQAIWVDGGSGGLLPSIGDFNSSYVKLEDAKMGYGYRLVQGEEALQCYTMGTIEGVPCGGREATERDSWIMADLAGGSSTTYARTVAPRWRGESQRWYLLQSRMPAVGQTESNDAPYWPVEVGGWKSMVGFEAKAVKPTVDALATVGQAYVESWREFPIFADIEQRIATILAPNKAWCSEPHEYCVGLGSKDPLPLEDELTDDGKGYEGSWQHYLTLAKDAATKSDALAQDYLESGISVSQFELTEEEKQLAREEKALGSLERVQQICGTAVDPGPLMAAFGGSRGDYSLGNGAVGGSCTSQDAAAAGSQLECTGGQWTRSWRKMLDVNAAPAMKPLADCLLGDGVIGEASTQDFTHLGDADLCVADAAVSSPSQCGGATQSPCPDTYMAGYDENSKTYTCKPGWTKIPAASGLSFFSTKDVVGDTSGEANLCADIRAARMNHDAGAIERIKASSRLSLANLQQIARTITIDPRAGMYVGVKVGGAYWETGDTARGPAAGKWPCDGATAPTDCPANSSQSLQCDQGRCGTYNDRIYRTHRLIRAALAAKASLWDRSFGKLTHPVPYQLYFGMKPKNSGKDELWLWRPNGLGAVSIDTYKTGNWRTYFGNLAAEVLPEPSMWTNDPYQYPGTAWWDHQVNWPLSIAGTTDSSFGFYMQEINSNLIDPSAYWAGIGNQGTFGGQAEGCVLKALLGQEPKPMAACKGNLFFGKFPITSYLPGSWPWAQTLGLTEPTVPDDVLQPTRPVMFTDDVAVDYDIEASADMFLDGLELLCMAQEQSDSPGGCGDAPPEIHSIDQLGQMGSYLQCLGNRINQRGAMVIFRNMPKAVLDPFRGAGPGVWNVAAGEIGTQLGDLRTELMSAYTVQSTIGHTVRQFGSEMRDLQAVFRKFATDDEIADVEFESTSAAQITACVVASSSVLAADTLVNWGKAGVTAATCANSVAQIGFANKLRSLKKQGVDAEKESAIARFSVSFDTKAQILDSQSTELSKVLERINTAVGKISNLRKEAQRSFGDALWSMSHEAKSAASVNSALNNRKALAYERYARAEMNARKMAYLAKQSIEQRLGVHLDQMTDELPLVAAPATWESKICSMSGLDYAAFSKSVLTDGQVKAAADGFLGDYVQKLENVVESYRLVNGFQDGSDTAVVSLRDDILGVKDVCQIKSKNLFVKSADLNSVGAGWDLTRPGWYLDGCRTDSNQEVVGDCISTAATSETFRPTGSDEAVPTFSIKFGNGGTFQADACVVNGAVNCGWQIDSKLAQRVTLDAGLYALSWYEKRGRAASPIVYPRVLSASGQVPVASTTEGESDPGAVGWTKRWMLYPIPSSADYVIGFGAAGIDGQYYEGGGSLDRLVAAPMLEMLPNLTPEQRKTVVVGFYEATDANGKAMVRTCADADGSEFRNRWTRACMKVCPDGYSSDCRSRSKLACYRELTFPITQRGIEAGEQFSLSGFARGSFNYRVNRIGFNVVGTGVRDCSSATASAACNAAGFATYTLLHEGPYLVRNHEGADFEATLREGRIEHARAVAAERYVTNPISSTDKSLLESYMRREMAGRPLDGNFVLRIWDDEGVDFSAIEDVQVILDYGYWTRQK